MNHHTMQAFARGAFFGFRSYGAAAAYFAAFAAFCDDAHHREPCQFVPGPCGALYGACRNLGHECGPACSGLLCKVIWPFPS